MTFQSVKQIFEAFNKLRVLIIGDVMVDAYDWGKVERISPEAPVPIISISKSETRLGGASNVALNVQAMGATPILCSVIGKDKEAEEFLKLLQKHQMTADGIIASPDRSTTTKRRVMAGSQHLLRIDTEVTHPLNKTDQDLLLTKIIHLLPTIDVLIFEDYDKGTIDEVLITKVVEECKKRKIPTAVDPKKRNFLGYKNVTLFKPNLKELKEGLKIELDASKLNDLNSSVEVLHQHLQADNYLITLSEKGVFLRDKTKHAQIPAHLREIVDVSGAGDTVISVASLSLALGLPLSIVAELSNLSGGLVCEHIGVVPIDKQELESEANKHIKIY